MSFLTLDFIQNPRRRNLSGDSTGTGGDTEEDSPSHCPYVTRTPEDETVPHSPRGSSIIAKAASFMSHVKVCRCYLNPKLWID